MRLLFLDIDGVLNGHQTLASGYCGIQYHKAVLLNRILDAVPDAQLVISSAWRYMVLRGDMTLKGFDYLLSVHGVKSFGRLHGVTEQDDLLENEPGHFDVEAWREIGLKMRAAQIRKYVEQHAPSRFCVIDDLPLDLPGEWFVQTSGVFGLTEANVEEVIRILSTEAPQ